MDVANLPSPPVYSDVSPDTFNQIISQRYQPAVIKGLAKDWPLVKLGLSNSSEALRYLQTRASSQQASLVSINKLYQGRLFYSDDFAGMNFSVTPTLLRTGLEQMVSQGRKQDLCFQCLAVKQYFPELFSELPNPLVQANTARFLWIGNQITVAPHFDEAQNIAVVAVGKRRFTFFPPEQVNNLYIGPLDYTPAGQPISLVDVKAPDLQQYPKYRDAFNSAYSVEVEAGDGVYIPSPWWHHVASLDEFNVLVNYWWSDSNVSSSLPLPMLGHVIQALSILPESQQQAWKAMLEHFVFADEQARTAHIPKRARGILERITAQSAARLHSWIKNSIR